MPFDKLPSNLIVEIYIASESKFTIEDEPKISPCLFEE